MRGLLFLVVLLRFSFIADAKCMPGYIQVLNSDKPLSQNGLIVLEFYGISQALVKDLNKKYPVYLQSGDTKIPVSLIETLKGEFQVTQVLLKSGSVITKNKTWQVIISNLAKDDRLALNIDRKQRNWISKEFIIVESSNSTVPTFNGNIEELKKTYTRYGCGPGSEVVFKLNTKDTSISFVRASVKNKTTGKVTDFIVAIEGGKISIGHGMCSGPFHFDDGNYFELTIALMDDEGNVSKEKQMISFTKPVSNYNLEELKALRKRNK